MMNASASRKLRRRLIAGTAILVLIGPLTMCLWAVDACGRMTKQFTVGQIVDIRGEPDAGYTVASRFKILRLFARESECWAIVRDEHGGEFEVNALELVDR